MSSKVNLTLVVTSVVCDVAENVTSRHFHVFYSQKLRMGSDVTATTFLTTTKVSVRVTLSSRGINYMIHYVFSPKLMLH